MSLEQSASQMRKTAEEHLSQLHQLQSTIENINREKGKLVEQGTHDELMSRQGLYYYLNSEQLG